MAAATHCDVMFVSPHPDDTELFCGGTVAHLTSAGRRVVIADLTRGELASNGTPEGRRDASLRAAAILGVEDRPVLELPDGGLDPRDDDQVEVLVRALRTWKPRWLIAPWAVDRHPDHEAASALARRAHFLAGVAQYATSAGYPFRPERLLFHPCHHEVEVSVLVDVSVHMETWRAALAVYADQFERTADRAATPINRPGFLDAEAGRRARWGQRIGVRHAEGFVSETPWPASFVRELEDAPAEEIR